MPHGNTVKKPGPVGNTATTFKNTADASAGTPARPLTVNSVTEPPARIVFYFAAISSLLSVLPLPWYWVTPTATAVGLLLLVGVFATAGQLLMTRAYAWYPVGPLAPFTYSSVLFAGLFGWLWWDEIMNTLALTGAGIIAVAGMIAATNERDQATSGWQQPTQLPEHAPPVRS